MFFQTVRHPGINSGLDLINSGKADTFGLDLKNDRDRTGNLRLIAMKDDVAVAYWQPDCLMSDGYTAAGWYCIRTRALILVDRYWPNEGTA
jgi:hypothetical protein